MRILEQLDRDSRERPLQFLSYTFKEREKKWRMPEKELFAFVFAVRKLRVYLYAKPFQWCTDASALQWLRSVKHLSPKLMRWALLVSEYRFHIKHITTKQNVVADALSIFPIQSISQLISSSRTIHAVSTTNLFPALPQLSFTRDDFLSVQYVDPFCRIFLSTLLGKNLPPHSPTQLQAFRLCQQHHAIL